MAEAAQDSGQVAPRFAGWRVLAAATVGLALGFSNIGVAAFGLFVIPLSQDFGWGRGEISVAVLLMNVTLVILSPPVGAAMDRFGARLIVLPSIALFAAAVAAVTLVRDSIFQFYALYIVLTVAGIGTIPATYTRVAIAWFDRKRGLAVGIAMAGVGLGAVLVPPFVQYLVGHFGWRAGYLGLAGLILFISWPVVFLFLRNTPSDLGQFADGARAGRSLESDRGVEGYEFRTCLARKEFWLMSGGFILLGLSTSGLMAHLVALLRDRGIAADLAALGASTLGFALVAGRIVCGLFLDRFHAPRVVVGFLLGPVVGLAMLALGASGATAFAASLLIGLGIGAELDFMSYLVSRYLGQRAYGRIYGLMYAAFAMGASVGPIVMGCIRDARGSYDVALWILCIATIIALIPFSRLGSYPRLPVNQEPPLEH